MPNELALEGRRSIADLIEVSLKAVQAQDEIAYSVFLALGAFFAPSATPELLTLFFADRPEVPDEMLRQAREQIPDTAEMTDEQIIAMFQQLMLKDLNTNPVDEALTLLQRRGLAERVPADERSVACYRLHDLAYSYARVQVLYDDRDRATDACLAYTINYRSPNLENFKSLRPEIDNFMGAAAWAFESGRFGDVEQLAWNLNNGSDGFLGRQGYYEHSVFLLSYAAKAAAKQGNSQNQAAHVGNLGITYKGMGQLRRAIRCYKFALKIDLKNGNKIGQQAGLGSLGVAYDLLGQHRLAIKLHMRAVTICREMQDRALERSHIVNIGNALDAQEAFKSAIRCYKYALRIGDEVNDHSGDVNIYGSLGNACYGLEEYQKAIRYYHQGRKLAQQSGERRLEANNIHNIGGAYHALGRYDRAISFYEQAKIMFKDMRLNDQIAKVNYDIAQARMKCPR